MTSRTEIPVLTLSCKAAGAIIQSRFVSGPKNAAVQTGAGLRALGVAGSSANTGDYFPVVQQGVVLVEAGGAISDDAQIDVDASGRAVVHAAGVVVGRAYGGGTTALGQFLQVLLNPN